MKTASLILFCLFLAACGGQEPVSVSPGRGVAARETGPVARVFPSGEEPRDARHGLWRGVDEEGGLRWEVRYTRGNPAGPYREWDEQGRMTATWSYNWDGVLTGWLRWFEEDGTPGFKFELTENVMPDFDPIGRAAELKAWAQSFAESE